LGGSVVVPSHLRTDWDICHPGVPRPSEDTVDDVQVWRQPADPDDPEDVPGWSAEGGMRGDSTGVAFEFTESLAEPVEVVMDEVAQWRTRYPGLPIVWQLDGDEEAMTDAAAREGVELPR
jgi:hypothetical protein